ncbi:MAG: DUF6580 family putative transport protein [Planctomycetota bacterium]
MSNNHQPTLADRAHKVLRSIADRKATLPVFALIVIAGVFSRFLLVGEPNFKPIGALVLFAGFYFSQTRWGVASLLAIMLISDLFLGFYEPMMMLAVYSSLMVCFGLGIWCRKLTPANANVSGKTFASFLISSLGMSCAFFLLTNFAVWSSGLWYPSTLEGLTQCFAAAIPFFRNTLSSDLLFSQTLLVGYATTCLVAKTDWLGLRTPAVAKK